MIDGSCAEADRMWSCMAGGLLLTKLSPSQGMSDLSAGKLKLFSSVAKQRGKKRLNLSGFSKPSRRADLHGFHPRGHWAQRTLEWPALRAAI
jgi:hypothetical protein